MLVPFFKQQRIIPVMILLALLLTVFIPLSSAQERNICRDTDAPIINFGETLVGFLDPNLPVSDFCFDAERGTDVTVTLTPITQNLVTALIVGTPFVDSDGIFVDDILILEESPANSSAYSGTASIPSDGTYLISVQGAQNIQGTFSITLELSGGNVLGSSNTTNSNDTTSNTEAETNPENASALGIADIVFGETDLCTVDVTISLTLNEAVESFASDVEPAFYCFEASAGDIITVNFSILSDVPMAYLIVDPLYDASPNANVYSQGFAQIQGEAFTNEFLLERSGHYALLTFSLAENAIGNFSLSLSSVTANVYTCDNEPLATLALREWGVIAEDGTEFIEINIACSERLSIATFGAEIITQYGITQTDEFFFFYQNRLYTTTSLSQDEWVIQGEDGQDFALQALSSPDTCSNEALQNLIRGSWLWTRDANQFIFFDFTCNGIVLIDDQQNPSFTGDYDYSDNTINIVIGDQVTIFSNIEVGEGIILADFNGGVIQLQDVLYVGTGE